MAGGKEEDLLTAVFDMDQLREKYQQFAAPAAKIWIGKQPRELVQEADVRVESIRVSLSLDSAASAEFTVADIWDDKQNAIKQTVKSNLVCGSMIKIELGYGSELVDVFHGFIYETGIQFSEMPSMQVTVMDIKRLMADNEEIDKVWAGQTLSNLFSALMGKYDAFGLSVSVEQNKEAGGGGDDELKTFIQRGSDLNLVRKICREKDLRFVVCGKTVKLTAKNEGAAALTLSWGKHLISFSQSSSYVNTEIAVRGTLKKPIQKNTSGDAASGGASKAGNAGQSGGSKKAGGSGSTDGSDQKKVMIEKKQTVLSDGVSETGIPKSVKVIELTNMKSEDEAASRLADEVESVRESMFSGRGSCIGMPVLIPGRYIGISGIDDSVDGDYYLKAVNHTFGADGFTTDFTLGGKKKQ